MRGLRALACGVALATLTALTVGLLQVLEVLPSAQEDWIPLAFYPFLALAILSPAVVGLLIALQLPRNRIAWILLVGALPPSAPNRLGAARRRGLGVPDRGGNRAAGSLRLAARRRVRLPERPAAVASLALGRRRGDRELRLHDRTEAVRSGAVPGAERGHHEPSPRQCRRESSSSTPAPGSRSPSGSSQASSPAPSPSSSAFVGRSASSACR